MKVKSKIVIIGIVLCSFGVGYVIGLKSKECLVCEEASVFYTGTSSIGHAINRAISHTKGHMPAQLKGKRK